jgi:hypothetical protein
MPVPAVPAARLPVLRRSRRPVRGALLTSVNGVLDGVYVGTRLALITVTVSQTDSVRLADARSGLLI